MTVMDKHELQTGLFKMTQGLVWVQSTLNYNNKESKMLLEIINGEHDEFVQEQYAKCFNHSLDEEVEEFSLFTEELLDTVISFNTERPVETDNQIKTLAVGLDLLIEGLEEVIEETRKDKELKKQLKNFSSSNGYQPFKQYGYSHFLKNLKGFRWNYLSTVKKEIGHYKFNQILQA
jgi:hypothetical protein